MPLVLALALLPLDALAIDWDHQGIPYGTDDPERQYLNIHLVDGEGPTPVLLYAHANGGSADNIGRISADLITGAGYALVSWESVQTLETPDDVLLSQADAQLAFDWVRSNAETYGLDPDHIVIGGRSRGSIASWRLAHGDDPAIPAAYFYNALPDGAWALPELWDPLDDVTAASPPMFLAFGPASNDPDIHDPVNLVPVVERYEALGLGDDIELVEGMDAEGLDPWHFFPDFVAGLEADDAPGEDVGEDEGDDSAADDTSGGKGCSTTAGAGAGGWALGLLAVGRRRRRR